MAAVIISLIILAFLIITSMPSSSPGKTERRRPVESGDYFEITRKDLVPTSCRRRRLVDLEIISEDQALSIPPREIEKIHALSFYIEAVFDYAIESRHQCSKNGVVSKLTRHIVINEPDIYQRARQVYTLHTKKQSYLDILNLITRQHEIQDPGNILSAATAGDPQVRKKREKGKKIHPEEAEIFVNNNTRVEIVYTDRDDSETTRAIDPYVCISGAYLCGFCHLRGDIRTFAIRSISSWKTAGQFTPDADLRRLSIEKAMEL